MMDDIMMWTWITRGLVGVIRMCEYGAGNGGMASTTVIEEIRQCRERLDKIILLMSSRNHDLDRGASIAHSAATEEAGQTHVQQHSSQSDEPIRQSER